MTVAPRSLAAAATLAMVFGVGPVAATAPDPVDPAAATGNAPTTTANPFYPDDTTVFVEDCVSSLPRPECGSKERGGWRQGAVFGVIIAGLVGIGARLVIGIRRRDRDEPAPS